MPARLRVATHALWKKYRKNKNDDKRNDDGSQQDSSFHHLQ
jgi:hypothetical protein